GAAPAKLFLELLHETLAAGPLIWVRGKLSVAHSLSGRPVHALNPSHATCLPRRHPRAVAGPGDRADGGREPRRPGTDRAGQEGDAPPRVDRATGCRAGEERREYRLRIPR